MASGTLGRTTLRLSYLSSIPLALDNFTLGKYYPGPSQLTYDPKIPRFISYVGVIRYLWTSSHRLSSSSSRIPPWISSFTSYESTWNLSRQSFVPRTRPGPFTQMLQRVTSYLSPSIFIAYFSGLRLFGFSVRFPLYLFWFPINNVCKDKISDELFTFQASKLFQNSNEMLLVYLCAT